VAQKGSKKGKKGKKFFLPFLFFLRFLLPSSPLLLAQAEEFVIAGPDALASHATIASNGYAQSGKHHATNN
jgi:hypothetical protein